MNYARTLKSKKLCLYFYLVLNPEVTFTVTLNKCKRHCLVIPDISLVTQVKPAKTVYVTWSICQIQSVDCEINSVARDVLNDTYYTVM